MNNNQSGGGKRLFKKMKDKLKEWNEPPRAWLKSTEALCEHLRLIGLEATVQLRKAESLGWQSGLIIGSVMVSNRNIDGVDLLLMSSVDFDEKYGSPDSYRCDFLVQVKVEGLEDRLKAVGKPVTVRKGFSGREIVDFKWKGSELAEVLNSDANLRDMLCPMKNAVFLRGLEMKPDRKRQCVRIRGESYDSPAHAFPTIETFEAFDRIAQHIRSIAKVRS